MRPVVELPLVPRIPIVYPESDGAPMGESEWHVFLMLRLLHVLKERFKDLPDVHVGGNLFIYFKEGDPTEVVCPDLFVAFGAKPGLRHTWKTWEEGGLFPQVIIELVSEDSKRRDLGPKRGLYEVMGILDYFVFDPTGEILETALRGWTRQGGALTPIPPEPGVDRTRLRSSALGVFLQEEGESLRLIDAETGAPLPFPEEEADARRAAEVEVARLRAEIERLGGK